MSIRTDQLLDIIKNIRYVDDEEVKKIRDYIMNTSVVRDMLREKLEDENNVDFNSVHWLIDKL